MIDTDVKDPIPLKQAASHRLLRAKARNGKALDFSTLHRWCFRGVRGTKLEFVRVGGTVCTSNEALRRFIDRLSGPSLPATAPTPSQASRAHRRAEAELTAAGV